MSKIYRSFFGKVMDFITFSFRDVLMLERGRFGLSSIRDERMRSVLFFCKGKVLDIGCGAHNLFINDFVGKKNGIGIDCFAYNGIDLLVNDMRNLPFEDCSFDTITLIGVDGHMPKNLREAEFKEFTRILKDDGLIIMDKGFFVTSFLIHKWSKFWFGYADMDSMRGERKKDEEYTIPHKELLGYLNTKPLKFIKKKAIWTQWGFKNVYVAQKQRI